MFFYCCWLLLLLFGGYAGGIEIMKYDILFQNSIILPKEILSTGFHPVNIVIFKNLLIVFMFRSEEHTSELQSRFDLVCRLLLEKKNMYHDMPVVANAACYT